jgi:hypothetical protein
MYTIDVPIVADIQLAIVGNATILLINSRIESRRRRRKTIRYELIVHERTHNDKRMPGLWSETLESTTKLYFNA